jgi:hypothetical protein
MGGKNTETKVSCKMTCPIKTNGQKVSGHSFGSGFVSFLRHENYSGAQQEVGMNLRRQKDLLIESRLEPFLVVL